MWSGNACRGCILYDVWQKVNIYKKTPKQRGNGQGSVYKAPNGKYIAEVTLYFYLDNNGKRHRKKKTKYFDKKKDAIAALPEMLASGAAIQPTSLAELHEVFLHSKKYDALSNSQKNKLRYAWNRLQKLHLRDITTLTIDDMQQAIDEQTPTFYPAKDMKTILSHCYTLAIQRELVQYNKTQYLELPLLKKSQRQDICRICVNNDLCRTSLRRNLYATKNQYSSSRTLCDRWYQDRSRHR